MILCILRHFASIVTGIESSAIGRRVQRNLLNGGLHQPRRQTGKLTGAIGLQQIVKGNVEDQRHHMMHRHVGRFLVSDAFGGDGQKGIRDYAA